MQKVEAIKSWQYEYLTFKRNDGEDLESFVMTNDPVDLSNSDITRAGPNNIETVVQLLGVDKDRGKDTKKGRWHLISLNFPSPNEAIMIIGRKIKIPRELAAEI